MAMQVPRDRAPDRARGRRRLLDVLPAARASRSGPRDAARRAALEAAAATSGRSVLISGLTVMVAMAGMFLTGDATFASFGVATILVVAIAMLGSLTVLPALLSRLGDKVDRVPRPVRRPAPPRRRRGPDLGRDRRPRPAAARCCRSSSPAGCWSPSRSRRSSSAWSSRARRRSRSRLPSSRPTTACSRPSPARRSRPRVVVKAPDVNAPAVQEAIDRLEQRALASGRMHEPITVDVNDDATVANITVPIDGNGSRRRARSRRSRALRDEIVPETVGALAGAEAGVTGLTAQWKDCDRRDEVEPAARGRVRPRVRVRADARRLPLDRDRGQGDRAQPALGRRRLRRAGARLPARLRQGPARLQLDRRHRPGRAAAPVRDPVRALDGLPRLRPRAGSARPFDRGAIDRTRRSRTGSSPPPASSRAPRS